MRRLMCVLGATVWAATAFGGDSLPQALRLRKEKRLQESAAVLERVWEDSSRNDEERKEAALLLALGSRGVTMSRGADAYAAWLLDRPQGTSAADLSQLTRVRADALFERAQFAEAKKLYEHLSADSDPSTKEYGIHRLGWVHLNEAHALDAFTLWKNFLAAARSGGLRPVIVRDLGRAWVESVPPAPGGVNGLMSLKLSVAETELFVEGAGESLRHIANNAEISTAFIDAVTGTSLSAPLARHWFEDGAAERAAPCFSLRWMSGGEKFALPELARCEAALFSLKGEARATNAPDALAFVKQVPNAEWARKAELQAWFAEFLSIEAFRSQASALLLARASVFEGSLLPALTAEKLGAATPQAFIERFAPHGLREGTPEERRVWAAWLVNHGDPSLKQSLLPDLEAAASRADATRDLKRAIFGLRLNLVPAAETWVKFPEYARSLDEHNGLEAHLFSAFAEKLWRESLRSSNAVDWKSGPAGAPFDVIRSGGVALSAPTQAALAGQIVQKHMPWVQGAFFNDLLFTEEYARDLRKIEISRAATQTPAFERLRKGIVGLNSLRQQLRSHRWTEPALNTSLSADLSRECEAWAKFVTELSASSSASERSMLESIASDLRRISTGLMREPSSETAPLIDLGSSEISGAVRRPTLRLIEDSSRADKLSEELAEKSLANIEAFWLSQETR